MWLAAFGDRRANASLAQKSAVLVVVVAAVREERVGPSTGSPDGRSGTPRADALAVGDDVVLAARPCAVDRAGTAFGPRRAARTWDESITALDQSSWFFDRSFFSRSACSWSQTPASFQAARRRQQVIPEPKPSSCGRYSHWMPVCRTNRMPHNACRSGTLGRPSTLFGPGSGNNGSINDHSSSETIHGRDCLFPTTTPMIQPADSHMINSFC